MLKYFVLLLSTLKNSDDVKLKVNIRQQAGMITFCDFKFALSITHCDSSPLKQALCPRILSSVVLKLTAKIQRRENSRSSEGSTFLPA